MAMQRLTEYPNRNEEIDSAIISSNTTKIQNNFDWLIANTISLGANNNFTGVNTFNNLAATMYSMKMSIEEISSSPSSDMTLDSVVKLFDCSTASVIATLPKLTDGNKGAMVMLNAVDVGSNTITVNSKVGDSFNGSGDTIITFDAVDDNITLLAISTSRWLVLSNNNCVLS